MDLDGDGNPDLLSGSYSRRSDNMAGLIRVFRGSETGFERPQILKGSDDKPLVITGKLDHRIGTRPFACDIDDDGDLDLIVGNIGGAFYHFEGLEGGKFSSESTLLRTESGKVLWVKGHSDPFLFDWDSDGDLDIVSGSGAGGVFLSLNKGTSKAASFTKFKPVIAPTSHATSQGLVLRSVDQIDGPHKETRVWIDDVNGDGKFDLLVGDAVIVAAPVDGVAREDVGKHLLKWNKDFVATKEARSAVRNRQEAAKGEENKTTMQNEIDELTQKLNELIEQREDIVTEDATGFVWVYYQK